MPDLDAHSFIVRHKFRPLSSTLAMTLMAGDHLRRHGDLVEVVGWVEHDESACDGCRCVEATGRTERQQLRAAWDADQKRKTEVIRQRRARKLRA